jgi:hypothetical protein
MKRLWTVFCLVLFLNAVGLEAADSPKILIKFPTRGRFEKFFSTLDLYYAHLSNEHPFHFVISCDIDDPVMNSPEAIAKLQSYPHLSYYFGNNKSKIEACNADIEKHLDFDILLLASDDMLPRVKGFDAIIAYCMTSLFPDLDGVLQFDDGFQHDKINTFPIMGKNFYHRFNYIYHPSYKSLFCDNEMTEVTHILNKCVYIDQILIEHCHPWASKSDVDELYRLNETYFSADRQNFIDRRAKHFDLH